MHVDHVEYEDVARELSRDMNGGLFPMPQSEEAKELELSEEPEEFGELVR